MFYSFLSFPSSVSLYNPLASHTSSSLLRIFLLPTFPGPRSAAVKLLRRVTRDSMSLHIGCNSSSVVISGASSSPSFLLSNLLSSLSICFFLHCIDAARDDAAGSEDDGPSSSPDDAPLTAPLTDENCLLPTYNLGDALVSHRKI